MASTGRTVNTGSDTDGGDTTGGARNGERSTSQQDYDDGVKGETHLPDISSIAPVL